VARRAIWAVLASIVAGSLWLAGILVFWAFWSSGFSWFQNLIVVVASLIVVGAIIGAAFVSIPLLEFSKWRRI
jgi:flagellar motor component MotA